MSESELLQPDSLTSTDRGRDCHPLLHIQESLSALGDLSARKPVLFLSCWHKVGLKELAWPLQGSAPKSAALSGGERFTSSK